MPTAETTVKAPGAAATYEMIDRAPAIADERLTALLAYWRSRRGARPMPAFSDIDPIDIPALLTYLWVHDYDRATDRFRVRLMGEAVRSIYSSRVVGADVEDLVTSGAYPVVAARYRAALSIPAVGHGVGRIYLHTIGRVGTGERLYLPMADDSGLPCIIFGATVYEPLADLPEERLQGSGLKLDTMTPLSALG